MGTTRPFVRKSNGILPAESSQRWIRAIDPETGAVKWQYEVNAMERDIMAGVLSTAGNLVFTDGAAGRFVALDAETGEELWHFRVGSNINMAPISYRADGKQRITIVAGNAILSFGLRD